VDLNSEAVKKLTELDDAIENKRFGKYDSAGEAFQGLASVAGGMASGVVGAALGLPSDVAALGVGIKDAIYAEDGNRMDAFSKGFDNFSKENLGSQFYKGKFNELLESSIDNPKLLEDAKDGFNVGEVLPLPTTVGATLAKSAKTLITKKDTAKAIIDSLNLPKKALKNLDVANMTVDNALTLAKKLKVARSKLYGADASGNVGSSLMAMTAKSQPSTVRKASETEQMISVFPKPERMYPKGEAPKGGDYLNPKTGDVITGKNVGSANIKINPDGRPDFKASNSNVASVGTEGKGNSQVLTNLFKRFSQKPKDGTVRSPDSIGNWQWTKTPDGFDKVETIISVTHKGKHYYSLETDFTKGVNLKKYPNKKDEPKLRPTVVGQIELGQPIGEISVRGNPHKVYNKIKTFNRGGLMSRT